MNDSLNLSRSTLSRTSGFIPSVLPSSRLPRYYDAWEDLCDNLPTEITRRTIRRHVRKLKVLNTANLEPENNWRRAYSILSYLVSTYIWTGDTPESIVPAA
ncbi:putative indoleamine 2,3-dioxygenase [Septoria linicola]|nr:putative indoleamine 2,3-dioxygenase [Septoria linicola]